jgi:hypothetical protein
MWREKPKSDRRLILGGFSFFGSFLMHGENGQCTEIK